MKEESALQKKNSSYENAECGRMARIKEYNGSLVKTTLEEIIVNTF